MRATFGMSSVLGYIVRLQAREFAVRMAFGATRRAILGMILHRGARLAVSGLVTGGIVAALAAILLRNMLPGMKLPGPETWLGVPLLLLAITVSAGYLPARSLLKENLSSVLRHE